MNIYDSKEYKRSRAAYIFQATTGEYFVSLLVTDAFLTRLLSSIGIADWLVGVISSFITLAFVIQIFSIQLLRLKVSSKKLSIIVDTLSILFFVMAYLVPFVPTSKEVKTALVIVCILAAYICKYLVLNILFKWGNSFVEPKNRGSFSAGKEMISLFSGMFFTAIIGYIIDRFEALGNLSGAFLFLASALLILLIVNFVALSIMAKENGENVGDSIPFMKAVKDIMKNKNFRSVIYLTILFDVSRYFTVGFLGVYKYKELMMSALLVQIVNIIASLARMSVSKFFGRFSDKYSFAKGFELGLWIMAAAFLINAFTTPSTWFLIILYTVLYSCSSAGTNANSFNITYSYVDSKYIVQAMAIKNCVGGIFGFVASMLGGKILGAVQANNNMVLGLYIYGQQLLSAVSFVFVLAAILYLKKVVEKQNVMVQ